MGLFDFIFKYLPKPAGKYQGFFRMLNGYTPHFSTFGGSIYEAQLVRSSINALATHIGKLNVTMHGTARPSLQRSLKKAPNGFQTWTQFLYRLATIYYVNNTAFIVPVFNEYGEITGVFPVLPEYCDVVQYNNVPYLRYRFSWGETAAVELGRCGIMTRFQYRDDLIGENNAALLPTMDLITIQNQGIQEGVKSAATYRFMAQLSNFSNSKDLAKERKAFSAENFSREAGGGGVLLFPNTYQNIKQIESNPYTVDADQMRIINEGVYQYFGVNEKILTNAAFGDDWSAFYEGAVEPFGIQFSEVLTKMLFSLREQAQGSFVMATANRIQYMSNSDKLNVTNAFADRGMAMIDELREVWNLPPLPDGLGQKVPIRGEYYDLKTGKVLNTLGGAEDGSENNPG